MSITSPIPDPISGVAFTGAGHDCFYCGRALSDPAIHWSGFTGDIYLHPACIFPLFIRLARDVHELDCPGYYQRLRARP
jgi:hypothetical protein